MDTWHGLARRLFSPANSSLRPRQGPGCDPLVAKRFHRLAACPSPLWLVMLMLVVTWLCFPAKVPAQVSTATVNGTVHDSSGAVVPGASVVLHNIAQSVDRTVTTNDVGYYVIENIIPGSYNLSVSKTGFTTSKQSDITLVVNQTATLDMTLSPGVVSEVVNVAAQAAALEASTAELGVAIVKTEVNDLPLNGRNFTQLLNLTPGVSTIDVSQNSAATGGIWSTPIGTFAYPAVNGQTNRSDLFFLDGLNDEGSFGSTYVVAPIVDDIQEFKVQSHNDDPAYGGALGGIVNAVTKSGTNAFHGSAWEFARNTSFDSRNTFLASRTPFQQNQFGGTIGGPVVFPGYNGHNKTFFFASYEGFRYHTSATNFYNTPTSAQLTGDLSGISGQIYNPFSGLTQAFMCDASGNPLAPNADGTQSAGAACNKIPSSLLDQNAVKYASTVYPAPNLVGNSQFNGLDLTKSITRQDEANLRLDHTFNDKNTAWVRYSGYSQPSSGSGGFLGLLHNVYSHGYNAGGGYTHTFGGTAVLDVLFGRDSANINQFTHYAGNPTPSEFGFAPQFYSEFQGGLSMVPNVVLSGYLGNPSTSAHNATQYDETHLSDVWEWKGDFTKNYQHHTFRMGADFVSNNANALYLNSSETYGTGPTAQNGNTAGTGNSLASFLLGLPTSYSRRNTSETQHGGWVDGFYFTDQWKATSKLTANLGLRYDVTLVPIYGNNPNVDYYVGDLDGDTGQYILTHLPPSCAVTNAAPCLPGGALPAHVIVTPLGGGAVYHTDKSNWQPRIGLAYQLRPSTVLRASYGRFFDNWGAITQTAQNYEGTWPSYGQQGGGNLNIPGGQTGSYENPANLPSAQPLPPPTPFGNQTWYADPFLKRPLSDQWNFGIQEALGKGTVLTVNYVGSHDGRLDMGIWTNTATTPSALGFQNGARSPYPYITPTDFDKSIGRSSYNALQASINGKLSTNLTYLISYTWSKSIDIGCSGWYGVEGCSIQNFYNLNADKGPSAFDLPQIFSLSWVYQLPIGHGQRWSASNKALDYVIGNWQFNGIATFTSGTPYTVGAGGEDDIAGTGGTEYNNFGSSGNAGYERMDIVGSPKLSSPTRAEWFNTSAFAAPAPGTFGTVGRDTLRSDPYKNFDLSLFRQFPITENKKLEFRFEMFNAFNQVVYSQPDAAYADGASLFGTVGSTANVARQMQFALKLYF